MITPVKRNVLLFTFLCVCLVTARILKTNQFSFIFLCWNLFLAFIPFLLSRWLHKHHTRNSAPMLFLLLGLWLLFLPNAPYMITDLFHLHKRSGLPVWFDLLLILSFATTGLYLFYLSVQHVVQIIKLRFPKLYRPVNLVLLFMMVSYGVYIGRFLRLNSWDVLHPFYLLKTCASPLVHISKLKDAGAFTLLFSVFLLFLFLLINPSYYCPVKTQKN